MITLFTNLRIKKLINYQKIQLKLKKKNKKEKLVSFDTSNKQKGRATIFMKITRRIKKYKTDKK